MKTLLSLLLGLVTGVTAGTLLGAGLVCKHEEYTGKELPDYATPVTRKRAYKEGYEACRKETIKKFFDKDIKIIND
jgi:acyl-CoA synthetase (NDP forming)